jgi:hypothetical protein
VTSCLRRYIGGDYESVWAELRSRGPVPDRRETNPSQDTTVTSSRYTRGTNTSVDHADPEATGQTMWRVFD